MILLFLFDEAPQGLVHLVVLAGIIQIGLSVGGMAIYAGFFLFGSVFGSPGRQRNEKQSNRTDYG